MCTGCYIDSYFHFYWVHISRSGVIELYGKCVFKVIKNYQHSKVVITVVYHDDSSSTSLPTLDIVSLFNFSRSHRYIVPFVIWIDISPWLIMLSISSSAYLPCICLLGKLFSQIFCPFVFCWVVFFLLFLSSS